MKDFFAAWTWKMAWRDARSNKQRLAVYIAAIVIGVAAQVAITSYRDNIHQTINNQARELLGADLLIESEQPFSALSKSHFDSLGGKQALVVELASMAYFPRQGTTRLSSIQALRGNFPFYGSFVTQPAGAIQKLRTQKQALVDQALMIQFGLEPGDSVRIGQVSLPIAGSLIKVPGRPAITSLIGPSIFIPHAVLDATGLIRPGSLAEYKKYFKFEASRNMEAVETSLESWIYSQNLSYETVEERKQEMGEAIANVARFFNLIGFIALLLGGIGIASTIHIYIKRKINTAAILRCMGCSSRQVMSIFAIQALMLGFLGAFCGVLLGVGIQFMLPSVFSEFLPLQIAVNISWASIGLGLFTGTVVAFVFALLPLLSLSKASPLYTLRSFNQNLASLLSIKTKGVVYMFIALSVISFAILITANWLAGLVFTLAVLLAFGLLMGVAKMLMKAVIHFFPGRWPYIWRQGLANLYRPNNQTTTLIVSLGLGVLLVSTLYFSQNMLMGQLHFASREDAPDLIFFDIQPDQNEAVNALLQQHEAPVLQNVPMVTMRIQSLNGKSLQSIRQDSSHKAETWALQHEYRSTYRDSLTDSETIIEGQWIGQTPPKGRIPISIANEIAKDLSIGLQDSLTFNVQGIPVKTYVSSIRKVEFQQVQPNFLVVFPKGVLEKAPQIYATVTRTTSQTQSLQLQQTVVKAFPNVSAIDISRILSTVQAFISKISFAIQFMALFSILTGLIVLASSVVVSRYQRVRESVLLRTLGAQKRQIISITGVEYFLLGILAAFTGLLLSTAATWLLGYFYFDIAFIPNLWVIIAGSLGVTTLTLLIGLLSNRSIYKKPPLEVLRLESG